jgi:hypothetical protein
MTGGRYECDGYNLGHAESTKIVRNLDLVIGNHEAREGFFVHRHSCTWWLKISRVAKRRRYVSWAVS